MILPADHVLRAVISARLPVPLLLLVCFWSYLFHAVMLPYQVGDVPLTCVAAVDYVSEMVENFCNDYYIPDEVHPVAPGRDNTITQFPEGKVGVYTSVPHLLLLASRNLQTPLKIGLIIFSGLMLKCSLSPFPCMWGYVGERSGPHLTARQEQTVRLLENNKAHFRRYPECFLCLVGLSPYYPFDDNTYPAFERPDGTDMGLFDFIKTADPRKVQAVEVQKKDDQVKLLESTSHCFMPLVTPDAGGSSSADAPEVSAPEVSVVPEDTYLDLTGPDEVVATQPGKSKRKRLGKQSDTLPAKQLRKDHPSFATGTGGKTLAGLRQLMPTSPLVSRPSFQADTQAHVVQSAQITDVSVYTVAATVTSARENVGITPTSDVAGSS
ncbi:hypothetical protein Tco_0732904 [Tanacetum coccineum]